MKVLLINLSTENAEVAKVQTVAAIGATVDMGYIPCPRVKDVTYYPKEGTIKQFGESVVTQIDAMGGDVDAIVFLE